MYIAKGVASSGAKHVDLWLLLGTMVPLDADFVASATRSVGYVLVIFEASMLHVLQTLPNRELWSRIRCISLRGRSRLLVRKCLIVLFLLSIFSNRAQNILALLDRVDDRTRPHALMSDTHVPMLFIGVIAGRRPDAVSSLGTADAAHGGRTVIGVVDCPKGASTLVCASEFAAQGFDDLRLHPLDESALVGRKFNQSLLGEQVELDERH